LPARIQKIQGRAAMNKPKIVICAALALASIGVTSGVHAQQPPAPPAPQLPQAPNMTFFVVGAGPGKGADLGGLEGADAFCLQLAQRHGAGGKTWRAYLSTQAADGKPAVNARDRIGNGPWPTWHRRQRPPDGARRAGVDRRR
jgi:hypothetical protein